MHKIVRDKVLRDIFSSDIYFGITSPGVTLAGAASYGTVSGVIVFCRILGNPLYCGPLWKILSRIIFPSKSKII